MAPRSRVLVRVSIFSLSVIFLFVLFSADEFINLKPLASISLSSKIQKQNIPKEILQSLSLTEEQCLKNFPELIYEIELAVARGPFELKRAADDYQGLVQGRIQDGKVDKSRRLRWSDRLTVMDFCSSTSSLLADRCPRICDA